MERYYIKYVPYYTNDHIKQCSMVRKVCRLREKCRKPCTSCDVYDIHHKLRDVTTYRRVYINKALPGRIIYPYGGGYGDKLVIDTSDTKGHGKWGFSKVVVDIGGKKYPTLYLDKNGMVSKMDLYVDNVAVYKKYYGTYAIIKPKPDEFIPTTRNGLAVDLHEFVDDTVKQRFPDSNMYHKMKRRLSNYSYLYSYSGAVYDMLIKSFHDKPDGFKVSLTNLINEQIDHFQQMFQNVPSYNMMSPTINDYKLNINIGENVDCVILNITRIHCCSASTFKLVRSRFFTPYNNLNGTVVIHTTGTSWRVVVDDVGQRFGKLVSSRGQHKTSGGSFLPVIGLNPDGTASELNILVDVRNLTSVSKDEKVYKFEWCPKMLVSDMDPRYDQSERGALCLSNRIRDMIVKTCPPESKLLQSYDSENMYRYFYNYYKKYGGSSKTFIEDFCNYYISDVLKQTLSNDVTKYIPMIKKRMFSFNGTIKSFDVARAIIPLANPDRGTINLLDVIKGHSREIFSLVYDKLEEFTGIPKEFFKMDNCTFTHDECLSCVFSVKEHPTEMKEAE